MDFTFEQLKDKSVAELQTLLAETREELRAVRFSARQGALKTVRSIRALRVQVAQILTALHSKR